MLKPIITLKDIAVSFDGEQVLKNVSFTLRKGDKVAFVGPNSIGKTMLFKILMGEEEPDEGSFKWGVTTTQAYLPSDNSAYFDGVDLNLVDWLRQYSKDPDETFVRGFLGRMLFSGEESQKKAEQLLATVHPPRLDEWLGVHRRNTHDRDVCGDERLEYLVGRRHCHLIGRHLDVTSAARAACSMSPASWALLWRGRVSWRPRTRSPAAAIQPSSSSRERRPRCSARSDRISQPSPPGSRWADKPARKPLSMRLSGS